MPDLSTSKKIASKTNKSSIINQNIQPLPIHGFLSTFPQPHTHLLLFNYHSTHTHTLKQKPPNSKNSHLSFPAGSAAITSSRSTTQTPHHALIPIDLNIRGTPNIRMSLRCEIHDPVLECLGCYCVDFAGSWYQSAGAKRVEGRDEGRRKKKGQGWEGTYIPNVSGVGL